MGQELWCFDLCSDKSPRSLLLDEVGHETIIVESILCGAFARVQEDQRVASKRRGRQAPQIGQAHACRAAEFERGLTRQRSHITMSTGDGTTFVISVTVAIDQRCVAGANQRLFHGISAPRHSYLR